MLTIISTRLNGFSKMPSNTAGMNVMPILFKKFCLKYPNVILEYFINSPNLIKTVWQSLLPYLLLFAYLSILFRKVFSHVIYYVVRRRSAINYVFVVDIVVIAKSP